MKNKREYLVLKTLKVLLNIALFLSILVSLSVTTFSLLNLGNIVNVLMSVLFIFSLIAITLVIYELRCIVQSVIEKKPFILKNVKRFNSISVSILVVAIFTLINNIIKYGYDCFYILHSDVNGVSSRPGILVMLLLAAISFVLGEVFKHAINIEEENRLTI